MTTVRITNKVTATLGELMQWKAEDMHAPIKMLLARAFKDHDINGFHDIDIDVIGPGVLPYEAVLKVTANYTF